MISSKNTRHIFLSMLIGLLIGSHNYNTLNFKSAWEKQQNLYQQLFWRAPFIKPGTSIISDQEILGYMGTYPTTFAINTIYKPKSVSEIPYWFFALSEDFDFSVESFIDHDQLTASRSTETFVGNRKDAIFINYEPEKNQCLWVLRPEDSDHKDLSPEMKKAASISNIDNITAQEINNHYYYDEIVKENRNSWCYYYQKADLALQFRDWNKASQLWQEAQSKGHHPDNGFEYIVFIEAYGQLGKWAQAFELSKTANKVSKGMYFILCPTWKRLTAETPISLEKDKYLDQAYQLLKCTP